MRKAVNEERERGRERTSNRADGTSVSIVFSVFGISGWNAVTIG